MTRVRLCGLRGACALAACVAFLGAAPPTIVPTATGEPWDPGDIAKLDSDLDALLASGRGVRGAHVGVLAVDARTGATLYAHNADDAFQPASTLKLVVGSAALEKLGGAFRFVTEAYVDGSPANGKLDGSLVLRGGGDPTLTHGDLAELASLVARSVRTLDGDVDVDDSRYDRRPYPAGWVWDDFAEDYAPKSSALTIDGNVREYVVRPGNVVGAPVRVAPNDRRSVASSADCSADPERSEALVVRANTTAPSSASSLDVERFPDACAVLVGSKPLGGESESVDVALRDPALAARRATLDALAAAGVTARETVAVAGVAATHRSRVASSARLIWSHPSAPLSSLLGPRFWIPSDNLFGELLLKELGYATTGVPGTTEGGIAYEKAWLQRLGVDPAALTLADGSGLSQYDRITPRALVTVLQHDWNGPDRQLIFDSLPLGGIRGTIEGIAGTPGAGRVFAKTGSMSHVRGLAGYLATQRHGAVTFAFHVDDWNGDYAALAALRAQALARIVAD